MKLLKTISKNLRVLFSMRLSLLAIIFGPVLVLALIGFAFNSSSNIQISVGYYAPDNSSLTEEFIQTMDNQNFILKEFSSQNQCIKEIQLGLLHTCIEFPYDFSIEADKVNNITFYVDKSRVNLAYNVIDSVSENIGVKSDELSRDLTETLTSTLSASSSDIDDTLGIIIKIGKDLESAGSDADTISDNLGAIDLQMVEVEADIDNDVDQLTSFTDNIRDEVDRAVREGRKLVSDLQDTASGNQSNILDDLDDELDDLNKSVNDEYELSQSTADELTSKVSDTVDKLDEIEEKFTSARTLTDENRDKIGELKSSLNSIGDEVSNAKGILEGIVNNINTIEITSSDQIVNPINTKIETVSADNNQLLILFPYVLMLIIMFVSMMLAGTLVVVEKKSRASFRVFTTPTKDEFFIMTSFITCFIIIILQTAVILGATSLFIVDLVTANIWVNILVMALAAAIFIMIGMAVGYLLPSQQAANMTNISLGSIFLFVSNIVLPVETISPYLREIASYNPYVLSSEILRRSILFNIQIPDIAYELGTLLGYTIIVLMLIIIFQRLSKAWYFKRNTQPKTTKNKVSTSHEYIFINGKKVETEKDFIEQLQAITDKEYRKIRSKNRNDLKIFVSERLKKPVVAKGMYKLSREQLLLALTRINTELMKDLESKKKTDTKTKKKDSVDDSSRP